MSWNIPDKKAMQPVPSIRWGRDSGVFFSLLITVVLLFGLFYYITHNSNFIYCAFVISLIFSLLFIIYIGLRLFQLGVALEKNEMISTESSNIDYEWSEWASGYISIVDYSYLFPEESQIPNLREGSEFNAIGTRALHFPESIDYTALFHELLAPIRARLIDITSKKVWLLILLLVRCQGLQHGSLFYWPGNDLGFLMI